MSFLNYKILNITLKHYLIGILIFLVFLLIKIIFKKYISKGLLKIAQKTKMRYDDIFIKALIPPLNFLLLFLGFYYSITYVLKRGNVKYNLTIKRIILFIVLSIILWAVYKITDVLAEVIKDIFMKSNETLAKQFTPLIRSALRVTVLVIGGLAILQNVGINVSSLLAGVGIGGLAIALAAQDTIANVFGTLVMFSDKPFKIGDYIEFKGINGIVEYIGFRSTKIRTFDKSLITVPNKVLTSEMIENWSARPMRRIKFNIGVTYDSKSEDILTAIKDIKDYIDKNEMLDSNNKYVNFTEFQDSYLNIFISTFALTTDYSKYLDVVEEFNIEIMKIIENNNLEFAFPSQSIYIEKNADDSVKGS